MKTHPYLVQSDTSGNQLSQIDANERHYDESWLQELLRNHPNLLPTSEVETVFSPIVPIGREVATAAGSIDNLFISPRGYLVLVETKLWRNPEARREVLAQAIDYGASLSKWTYDQLNQVVRGYTSRFEGKGMDLTEWVEAQFWPVEGGIDYFEDIVSKNLRLGRFLTLIVGDHIRQSLLDMMSYVNKYPHLAMNIALIELSCYRWEKNTDWPLVVVPNLIARTEIIERSVVQVTLIPGGGYTVEASQEKATGKDKGQRREFLTEETYWDLLQKRSPEGYELVHQVIERYRHIEGVVIEPSTGSIVVRLDIQDSGEQATLFYIDTNGNVINWPDVVRSQIIRGGLNGSLADPFETGMNRLLKRAKQRCSQIINRIDLPEFFAVVDALIQSVQTAEREVN